MPDSVFKSAAFTAGDVAAHQLKSMTPTPAGFSFGSVQAVVIKAAKANTGIVWVGDSSSVAANAGYGLDPGESLPMEILNPGLLYILQSVAGDRFYVAVIRP